MKKQMKAKMDEQMTEKSEKQQNMFFEGKEKLNKESDQNGRCKKRHTKNRE